MKTRNDSIIHAISQLNHAIDLLDDASTEIGNGRAKAKSEGLKSYFHQKEWEKTFAEQVRISKAKAAILNIRWRLEKIEA